MKNELRWKIAQAAEIRWWQNYLNKKPKADYLDWKSKYWQNLLTQIGVAPASDEKILDVGCGPAGIFMVLKGEVDAVDPLLDSYAEKLDHFDASAYPHVQFHALPFEQYETTERYDTLFCLNAINHVADLSLCFDKLVGLVKPGGKLVVSIDAHNFSFFKHVFRLLPGDILHPHQYDLKEYQKMLTTRNCQLKKSVLFDQHFLFNYYVLVAQKGTSGN